MSGFGVEVGGLRAAANVVAELTEDLRRRLQRVEAVAEDVFAGGWSGVAAAAYRLAWDEWRGAARGMLLSLAEMSDALGRTAADYAAREQAAVGGFERIA